MNDTVHSKHHGSNKFECDNENLCKHCHCVHFNQLRTMLSASDLSQNPERSGLGGTSAWAPVLCVLRYALPTSISMSGHMVKMDVCLHDVFPGNSGRTGWMILVNILLILNAPSQN